MSTSDLVFRNFIQLTKLQGIEYRAGYIFNHYRCLDRCLGRFSYCEHTVVLHQESRTGADQAEDLLSDLLPVDPGMCPNRDRTAELVGGGNRCGGRFQIVPAPIGRWFINPGSFKCGWQLNQTCMSSESFGQIKRRN